MIPCLVRFRSKILIRIDEIASAQLGAVAVIDEVIVRPISILVEVHLRHTAKAGLCKLCNLVSNSTGIEYKKFMLSDLNGEE